MKDWKAHITGILIFSVIITIMVHEMMGKYFISGIIYQFIIILINTATLWIVNSYIFYFLYKKYPSIADTRKRIIHEIIAMTVVTSIVSFGLYMTLCYSQFGWRWNVFYSDLKYSFLFTGLAVIFHESVFFFHRWKESLFAAEKLQKETSQAQLESLRTQVNPHFLFNSLNTLIALIPQDAAKSVDFVRKLSEVYRYLLKAQCSELTSLAEEMKTVNAYLFLLETRFQNALHVNISLDENAYMKHLPPVSVQLLIENCIKHNIVSKDKPLTIEIYSERDTLVVKNNFQKKEKDEESTGLGLLNIKKRYAILSDREIEIIEDGKSFIVKLPLLEIS